MGCLWISLIVVLVLAVSPGRALGDCAALNDQSSVKQLISFLQASKELSTEQRDRQCVVFAIKHLEYKPSPETATVLVDYLDFERPLSEPERKGFMIHGPPNLPGTRYPATGTLMTFGESTVPVLISAIKSSSSKVVEQNAVYTLMQIFREQPEKGIDRMRREALASGSPAALRLRNAMRDALQWCGDKYRNKCEAASAKADP